MSNVDQGMFPSVDLFKAIAEQAVEAAGVDVAKRVVVRDLASLGLPGEVLIIDSKGDSKRVTKPDPARRHKLSSCRDVIKFVKSGIFEIPVVWIGPACIFITDDNGRLRSDYATYDLKNTEMFDVVEGLGDNDGYTQADFLSLLRVDLARAFLREDDRLKLISKVRNIIKREQSMIGKGSGSFEVGVVNAQNQVVEWEDSLSLATTVLDDPEFSTATYPVEVILDNRPESRTPFVLKPVPADITKAKQEAMAAIKGYIEAEVDGVNVFLGAPA